MLRRTTVRIGKEHHMYRPIAAAMIALASLGSLPSVALAQDASQLRNLMKPGATVFGQSGKAIGTVESIDARTFVLKTPDGPVTLSRGTVNLGVKGLFVDKTPSQIRALAASQAATAASPAG
jgi:hypothetical protein